MQADRIIVYMNRFRKLFTRYRSLVLYGGALALLVFLLKWMEWKFLLLQNSLEIYIGLIALFFTGLGIWVATRLSRPKVETVVIKKEIPVPHYGKAPVNEAALRQLDLSKREYEILQLLVRGHSNAEIARTLFLSVSTVKTHVSNLYVKMDVLRRAQAIEKANRLRLVP